MQTTNDLRSIFTNTADAIREKTGSTEKISPRDFPTKIKNISSSGLEINGLVEEYKVYAGENISAGDFVNFINTIVKTNDVKDSCYLAPSCILLEDNKVFIAHSCSGYLDATIVEINETEIITTTRRLNSKVNICTRAPSCILLENNKVFIAHVYSHTYYLYGTIVEINGTEMTATTTQLNSTQYSCYWGPSCILLENNKVFIAHSYGGSSSTYLYSTIVEINGTEITATTTQLSETKQSCVDQPSCILLEDNKVFIAHPYGSSKHLYGTIVEINGTEITATTTRLNTKSNSCYSVPSCILLENNKVFIAHAYGSTRYLYGTIVEINGTEMTATTTQLDKFEDSCYYVASSCILLENNKVFIAHAYSSGYCLYSTIVEINGTEMTATTTQLNSTQYSCYQPPSCILLENNKVFIAHSYGNNKYLCNTIKLNDYYYITSATTEIKGIAKTGGTGGDIIQVYVPNKQQ